MKEAGEKLMKESREESIKKPRKYIAAKSLEESSEAILRGILKGISYKNPGKVLEGILDIFLREFRDKSKVSKEIPSEVPELISR